MWGQEEIPAKPRTLPGISRLQLSVFGYVQYSTTEKRMTIKTLDLQKWRFGSHHEVSHQDLMSQVADGRGVSEWRLEHQLQFGIICSKGASSLSH